MHCSLIWASKGGSGKTTTTGNLAAALALDGYDVIAIDADPDGDLGCLFGIPEDDPSPTRLHDLLADPSLDPRDAALAIPVAHDTGRLRILVCSQPLEHAALSLAENDYQDLRRILDAFENDADVALIDVPGARGPFVTAGLRAADSLLLPLQPGDFERSAMHRALIQSQADAGVTLPILGVAFVNTPLRSRALREHRRELQTAGIPTVGPQVRRQVSVLRDPTRGGPSVLSNPKTDVAKDYRKLAAAFIDRIIEITTP